MCNVHAWEEGGLKGTEGRTEAAPPANGCRRWPQQREERERGGNAIRRKLTVTNAILSDGLPTTTTQSTAIISIPKIEQRPFSCLVVVYYPTSWNF